METSDDMTVRREKNMCGRCMGPIERLSTGQWVHVAPDYDPFESIHVPTPANLSD